MDSINFEKVIGDAAARIAHSISADCVVSAEKHSDYSEDNNIFCKVKVNVFRKTGDKQFSKSEYMTKIRRPESGNMVPMKELLMDAISHKMIKKGERVVCIQDSSLGAGYKGMLFIFDVDKLFFDISKHKLAENISSGVVESVLDIAIELARHGREGKKVGTSFIVGDHESVLEHTKQLIINPFKYIDKKERNIVDPNLRETVKEFAQLDGAFVIGCGGIIHSVGSYLTAHVSDLILPHGLGTRHRSSAAITVKTGAIGVVVSESGKVRVFRDGRIVMTI